MLTIVADVRAYFCSSICVFVEGKEYKPLTEQVICNVSLTLQLHEHCLNTLWDPKLDMPVMPSYSC